jgi:hypothetical protein
MLWNQLWWRGTLFFASSGSALWVNTFELTSSIERNSLSNHARSAADALELPASYLMFCIALCGLSVPRAGPQTDPPPVVGLSELSPATGAAVPPGSRSACRRRLLVVQDEHLGVER